MAEPISDLKPQSADASLPTSAIEESAEEKQVSIARMVLSHLLIALIPAVIAFGASWYSTSGFASRVADDVRMAQALMGCGGVFEAKHLVWPGPEQSSPCRKGWELRELFHGAPLSNVLTYLVMQRTAAAFQLMILAYVSGFILISCIAWPLFLMGRNAAEEKAAAERYARGELRPTDDR
jgi:hypothetical protein